MGIGLDGTVEQKQGNCKVYGQQNNNSRYPDTAWSNEIQSLTNAGPPVLGNVQYPQCRQHIGA